MGDTRILFVGGEDVHLRMPTVERLLRRGYRLGVAAPVDCAEMEALGCRMFRYDLDRGIAPHRDVAAMRQLLAIEEQWRPAIIHSFDTKPNFLLPLAFSGRTRTKIVRTITGMGKIFTMAGARYAVLRAVYDSVHRLARRRSDFTIFQNDDDAAHFLERGLVSPAHSAIIAGSGIDVEQLRTHADPAKRAAKRAELGLAADDVCFALVARIIPEKGVFEYFAAARALQAREPHAKFLLIGPGAGEEPGAVPPEAISANSDVVQFLGRRSDIPAILNAIDVFVLPTKYREGVPRAMLEAMAMELPVIVSDMPGCRQALAHAAVGTLTRPGDGASLEQAMAAMVDADRAAMGTNARRVVEDEYSLETVVDRLEHIYQALLADRSVRTPSPEV